MSALFTMSIEESIEKLLAHCHRRTFAGKAAIIRQGDPAGELYYIISGSSRSCSKTTKVTRSCWLI